MPHNSTMTAYKYNTLADVLDAINDDRCLDRSDVRPSVLSAKVWQAIVSFPGCLGDSHAIARSKEDALASVEYWLDDSENSKEFSAHYVRSQLRKSGICYLRDGRVITLDTNTISGLF